MSVARQHANEVERAVDLGCDRENTHIGPGRGNLTENFFASKLAFLPSTMRESQALARLRAALLRIDEIAFDVRRQHAG